jgi:hypothetical protein
VIEEIQFHSSITWDDLVEIVATTTSVYNSNFHCKTSEKKGCFQVIPEWRRVEMKGCSGKTKAPVMKWKDKLFFFKCPVNMKSGYVEELITLARQFESGVLPYSGGLYDQPAKMVDIFNQINSLRIEDEISRSKQQEKKWHKTQLRSNLKHR